MDKEMELLLSEKEVTVGNKNVVVKRIALLDTIRLASQLSDIVSTVLNSNKDFDVALYKIFYNGGRKDEDGNDIKESENEINAIRFAGILELIGLVGDDAVNFLKNLIVKSTNISFEDVESVDASDGIDLLFTIYEVNKNFFKKCMSKLKGIQEKVETKEKKKK